jgi:hypothetical protein
MDYFPIPTTDQQILIHAFQQERDLAVDVNITGTRGSNDDPIEQLQKAVDRKNTFYLARCEAVNIDFTTTMGFLNGEYHSSLLWEVCVMYLYKT